MNFAGLLKNSTVDFHGRFCAVLFVSGCNYRCFYCHNRHILDDPPPVDPDEILSFLKKRVGLLDGVVISGGEPTLDPGLIPWIETVKALGYPVKLDTNGSRPDVVQTLVSKGLVDYVAVDYKAPFSRYREICRAPADGVLDTVSRLRESAVPYELRTTVVPNLSADDLTAMASAIPPLPRYALQAYRPQPGDDEVLSGLRPYTREELLRLAEAVAPYQPRVFVRA
jgi:pyruvate formate lyase activating enzyme